ncbi:MAG: hypothetical protein H6581_17800 [Bacteroidia bacterium]|nr:hypothetical protein [Bacteroidia bacterium]
MAKGLTPLQEELERKTMEIGQRLSLEVKKGNYTSYHPRYPEIQDDFHGRRVILNMSMDEIPPGNPPSVNLSMQVNNPEKNFLSISRADFLEEIIHSLGLKSYGNQEPLDIDLDFTIRTHHEGWKDKMLDEKSKNMLQKIWADPQVNGLLELLPGRFMYVEESHLGSVDRICDVVELMHHLAERMEGIRFLEGTGLSDDD